MTEPESRTITRTDWLLIGVLIALVLPLRLWLLYNTEVTARDSIGYIRYALRFERLPWQKVWQDNHQHPGFPICVWAMSQPVRAIAGETTPENMEFSAQLVSFFASLLLIVPMYLLGRQFFDRIVSFGGALLYQYLPVSAHHLSDGISEPIYLLLLMTALLHLAQAIRDRCIRKCVWCGAFTGIAYLFRPEGLLIVPTFGLALIVVQFVPDWRSTRRRFLACGAAMVLTATLVGAIYVGVTGQITNKPAATEAIKNFFKGFQDRFTPTDSGLSAAAGGHLFAATFVPTESRTGRIGQSVSAYSKEILQGLHYIGIVPAFLGFYWAFPVLRRQAGFWALAIYGFIHSAILIALAMTACYVSDRHVMILVLLGCFFAVFGMRELPRRILGWFPTEPEPQARDSSPTLACASGSGKDVIDAKRWWRSAHFWFVVLFVGLMCASLPRAFERLHGTRVGNREAGLWLKEKLEHGDVVVDDHAWSAFFAGTVFKEGFEPALPKDHQSKCWVVTTRSRDPEIDARRMAGVFSEKAKLEGTWPEGSDIARARIVIHSQPREYKKHPWRIAKD